MIVVMHGTGDGFPAGPNGVTTEGNDGGNGGAKRTEATPPLSQVRTGEGEKCQEDPETCVAGSQEPATRHARGGQGKGMIIKSLLYVNVCVNLEFEAAARFL